MEAMYELSVCVDCVLFIANGDLPEDADRAAAIENGCIEWNTRGAHLVLGDEDHGFCMSRCDLCGDRHYGDRHRVVGLTKEGK